MRLFNYKCPVTKHGSCYYAWGDWDDKQKCTKCGVSYSEAETVWDKIRTAYYAVVPFNWRPNNAWYSFTCWAWKRYTTVKPRTLSHNYCDKDGLLIHCVFEIARTFLETEGPKTEQEWEWQKEHNLAFYESWKEAKELVDWFLAEGQEDSYPFGMEDDEFDAKHPFTVPSDYEGTRDDYRGRAKFIVEEERNQKIRDAAKRIIDISLYFWT